MTDTPIKPGLYRINWRTGGSSLAAVGVDRGGARWLAPINWVEPSVGRTERSRDTWLDIESYEPIDPDASSKLADVSRRNAELADITEALLAEVCKERYDSAHAKWYQPIIPERVVELRDRLLNPRASTDYVHVRDRDAALAALSHFVGRDMRILWTAEVDADSNLAERVEAQRRVNPKIEGARMAFMVPACKSNPDLLERASTLLAEAYIAAKKEGQ